MPASVQVSYPGVYVQEIPSGNVTISGVATSITAFVGRAVMGTNEPMHCFSFADFERYFGGRAVGYPLGYAVEDFFQNGGSHAVIARVFKAPPKAVSSDNASAAAGADPHAAAAGADPHAAASGNAAAGGDTHTAVAADAAKAGDGKGAVAKTADGAATAAAGGLTLVASSPGTWANGRLAMSIDVADAPKKAADSTPKSLVALAAEPFERYGLQPSDLFTLTLTYTTADKRKTIERFPNVTVKKDGSAPNRLDFVLKAQSQLARAPNLPDARPSKTTDAVNFDGGSDSAALTATDLVGDQNQRTGIYALDGVDIFNLLCIPPDPADAEYDAGVQNLYQKAAQYCWKRRAMLILDPPKAWGENAKSGKFDQIQPTDLGISGPDLEERNCAVYFPRINKFNPETQQIETFPACGALAGIFATTDNLRGVWKAPAGITAGIGGINALESNLTDDQNGMLNQLGINCLRNFPIVGPVVWGARTLRGADVLSDDYKYVPVRRLTLYIEESLYRGTKFAVFEPNDETLWSQLRLSIGAFMADLARQGAFYRYDVACDKSTTTQYDIDRGIVNVRVAFAPVKPAEFIVLQIQQQAGQTVS